MIQDSVTREQALQVYRYLLQDFARMGQPPALETMANELNLSSQIIQGALDVLEAGGSIYRDPETREILAAYPFSAKPTDHIVRFEDGHWVYSMCAIDALGMPVMLYLDATIESRCSHCGRAIGIAIKNNGLAEFSPQETRVWYVQADACCIAALEQCPSINFFCSAEHLDAWRTVHSDVKGMPLTMDEAFEYGKRIFGNLLKRQERVHAL